MSDSVIVIVVDALRADKIGVNGYYDITPNIDSLAADGTNFSRAFSTTNATDPAMTSLHTGKHLKSHGIHNHGGKVTQQEISRIANIIFLQEILNKNGYTTFKIGRPLGRWHKRGFDYSPTLEEDIEPETAPDSITAQAKQTIGNLLESISPKLKYRIKEIYNGSALYRSTSNLYTPSKDSSNNIKKWYQEFVDKIEYHKSEPFYGLLHLEDTHVEYKPANSIIEEHLTKYDYNGETTSELKNKYPDESWINRHIPKWVDSDLNVPATAIIKAKYDAAVREADEKIGYILDKLRKLDLYDDSMIIVLADHGESMDEHGIYFDHHGLYEPTIRIPLIIKTPSAQRGSSDELVQITDIAPTILDQLSIKTGIEFDGQSVCPLLYKDSEEDWPVRQNIIAEENHTQQRRMIRTESYKLIEQLGDSPLCRYCRVVHSPEDELYVSPSFDGEVKNNISNLPDVADRLRRVLTTEYDKMTSPPDDGDGNLYADEKEALESRLKDLGYI